MPPHLYILAKLCRSFQCLPWDIDPSIEKGDLQYLYGVLDMLSYDDAWKQFTDDPEKVSEGQAELIEEIRYLKRDLWP